jgi:outer membrane receptor protein involved in Fe transport
VAFRVTSQLTALANVTVTRGQDTLANVPLRFIPPANGLVGVLWERPARGAWLEANARVADRLRRHAPQDELDAGFSTDPGFGSPSATNPALPGFQIPGWTMVTVRGGITVWQAAADRTRIEATLDVNNVFNAQYREAYSQQQLYAPSAGVVAGLRVRF